ncbi:MAG TPA: hypothetical protein VK116_16170, partial [Planctomycetota bacterium]|nr:hypothetical protein [Planctomycetota bacterium]
MSLSRNSDSKRSRVIFLALPFLIVGILGDAGAAPAPGGDDAQRIEKLVEAVVQSKGVARRDAIAELIESGDGATEAIRAARARTDDADALRALDHVETWILAHEIYPALERGLETQLVFDGQYSDLEELGPGVARALVAIVDDSATEFAVRIAACRALADVGDRSVIPELRRLGKDILLPHALREQLNVLLAIFGDRRAIEDELADYERFAKNEMISVRLAALSQLANLSYRIRDYKRAVECYEEMISIYEQLLDRQRTAGASPQLLQVIERELTLHYYNAACSNTLHGDIEKA